ncbi:MAG: energy transducer TonB, partial [Rhodospirillales bacterium]|nr:energy transducer TonB [Rhodospirillales bacterium]
MALSAAPRRRPKWAVPASALLHLALLGAVLLWQARHPRRPARPDTPVRVALLLRESRGARRPGAPPAPPPSPPRPTHRAPPGPISPAPPPRQAGSAPPRPASAPAPHPPPGPPPSPPAPRGMQFNLAGANDETNAIVRGNQVVAARPDGRFRNLEPAYPAAAAIRREQGTVELIIHIGPDGRARAVDIARSSGYPALDDAARKAVLGWHFLPALVHG